MVGTSERSLFGRAVIPIMIEQRKGGDIINIATDHMVTCGTPYYYCEGNSVALIKVIPTTLGTSGAPDRLAVAMQWIYESKWALNGLLYGWAKH